MKAKLEVHLIHEYVEKMQFVPADTFGVRLIRGMLSI